MSRVVSLLEAEGVVETERAITRVDWERVLLRWTEDYGFERSNRVVPCIAPRGTAAFVRQLMGYGGVWAATGVLGLPAGLRVVPVQLAAIYVPSPEGVMEELALGPTAGGANVALIEPPDEGPLARSVRGEDGVVRLLAQPGARWSETS